MEKKLKHTKDLNLNETPRRKLSDTERAEAMIVAKAILAAVEEQLSLSVELDYFVNDKWWSVVQNLWEPSDPVDIIIEYSQRSKKDPKDPFDVAVKPDDGYMAWQENGRYDTCDRISYYHFYPEAVINQPNYLWYALDTFEDESTELRVKFGVIESPSQETYEVSKEELTSLLNFLRILFQTVKPHRTGD